MLCKIVATIVVALCASFFVSAGTLKGSSSGAVVVHATSNSSVPNVAYIVEAVECLKQSLDVYADELNSAKLYAALFQSKHPECNWNVAVGYTTLYINSTVYVEASVTGGGKQFKSNDKAGKLYMIFNSNCSK